MVGLRKRRKLLVVVDMQNDFITGSLGTKEAKAIVPKVANKIKNWQGDVILTLDTHDKFYLDTNEGKHLPTEHCIEGTQGHSLETQIMGAAMAHQRHSEYDVLAVRKHAFGHHDLVQNVQAKWGMRDYDEIQVVGVCTDICVLSNANILKSQFPETPISVDALCCAGTTPERHMAALAIMQGLHIDIRRVQI